MAETTTTIWLPGALSATRRATFMIFGASATDEPPYFWTRSAMLGEPTRRPRRPQRTRPASADGGGVVECDRTPAHRAKLVVPGSTLARARAAASPRLMFSRSR